MARIVSRCLCKLSIIKFTKMSCGKLFIKEQTSWCRTWLIVWFCFFLNWPFYSTWSETWGLELLLFIQLDGNRDLKLETLISHKKYFTAVRSETEQHCATEPKEIQSSTQQNNNAKAQLASAYLWTHLAKSFLQRRILLVDKTPNWMSQLFMLYFHENSRNKQTRFLQMLFLLLFLRVSLVQVDLTVTKF